MGLASSLTTALTGITAAETQIDVAGNNLANSQTVGFKASEAIFAAQFLQTLGLGSAPGNTTGGTNPRQIGLGTQVAEITPNFTQGTLEVSSNPSDLAIQGSGFFVVQGTGAEQLYTRNGVFKLNAENQLVTITGNRLLGFGVDEYFDIQRTQLTSLEIPLGSAAVATPTRNVFLEGILTPTGDIADTAEVIESAVLGDAAVPRPNGSTVGVTIAPLPDQTSVTVTQSEGAGGHSEGDTFRYRFTFVDDSGSETLPSQEIVVSIPAGDGLPNNTITLNSLPTTAATGYSSVNVYRTAAGGSDFFLVGQEPTGGTFVDGNTAVPGAPLDNTSLTGNYSYLITYAATGAEESRPSEIIGPQTVTGGRIQLQNFPPPPVPGSTDTFPAYDRIRIYRNLATDPSSYYLVEELLPTATSFTDGYSDADIAGNQQLDMDGPKITTATLLTNVLKREDLTYEQIFPQGTLTFAGRKGGRGLEEKTFEVTSTSTVQNLIDFLEQSLGIQSASDDPQNPVPNSVNNIAGDPSPSLAPGGTITTEGRIRLVGNNGVDNALSIGLSAFTVTNTAGTLSTPQLGFSSEQTAVGQSAATDFIAYDSLGIPIQVRITAVLENRTDSETIYRWFADSPDNDPLTGADVSVGTGIVRFDGEGNLIAAENSTVTILRRNVPSASPLEFELNFSEVTGLASASSSLAASRQDGSAPGTLTSFQIGEDGIITGAFSSGVTRSLGMIQLARFSNPNGLQQRGENMYAVGSNSGLPVQGDPGENGIGTIVGGAVELSNTDIGRNLIDLVLATTQFRGNARVISTAQQLLDELMNLRR